ncbi:endo-beta-N-acetylglucosaminidase [Streptomyces longispororuber]|uniref:endo-beta-N-acetylglucosaminidase n=1 Tax=Streptomyces longispororuber TaxID=68230 RepID=UPI00210A67AC|nr:hypothetical protein [Streptomyces longispororuber]MCQ4212000.1 hypothetical protein [Streptomyces longispororuber]
MTGRPFMHGYDAAALKGWSPRTDRWARYFRSRVPLAPRIGPFPATQARPGLTYDARVMNLCNDYDGAFWTARRRDDVFARRLLRFWQYSDFLGSWHGLPVDGSPADEPVHGLVNLPNPAYTDAAHRNGVRSLGCWFWPRTGDFEEYLEERPDGSFPVADKLVEMAAYFGFDGYFVNHEAATPPDQARRLLRLLRYLRSRAPGDFHVQWYDTIGPDGRLDYRNGLDGTNADWLEHGAADSFFANYWMTEEGVERSRTTAVARGLDPYATVFHGTENEQFGFDPEYDPRLVFPEGGPARTSWALFGSHFVWELHPGHADPDDQEAVFRRERQYWSGPRQDPSRTGRLLPHAREHRDRDDPRAWDGVAHYVAERSVVGAFPFVTRFNTGHGRAFFLAGRRVHDGDWCDASVQDVLPTWQFWTEGTGSVTVGLDHGDAYDGGASLLLSGALGPGDATTVRLYKTELRVTGGERLAVTARGVGAAELAVGLLFADAPGDVVWLAAEPSDGWRTTAHGLGPFRGRTVAALALRVGARRAARCAVRVGELALLPGGPAVPPAVPEAFAVDAVDPDDGTAFLSWRLATSGVWHYDLLGDDGRWLGRAYDDVYCLPGCAPATGAVGVRLVAVAPDGTRGAAARVTVLRP